MNKMTKRSLAFLLVVVICVALLPTFSIDAYAASSSDVEYVYSGKYIYNWGERGEVATFLSPKAEEFYTGTNTYDSLSMLSGGTKVSTVPGSALYNALQSLMKSNHSYETSYSATKDLYKYTDCQKSGGKISSFYSGTLIGPAWGEGNWNREHTWPDSKGLGGNDENDIMMLRPTSTSENSSRGNTAYGQSSGYYNPNSESGGKYDLRGDVARIFLYVYVRWGNTTYAWGKSGVMESVDVMLDWMEADPVDTWEMGRNDSVESITGTRNVFVDYPEFAFLLFGEDVPADMQTPSGGAASNMCDHNNFDGGVVFAATCTTKGYTVFTCQTSGCGYSYQTNAVPATGHNYVSGACATCGEAEPLKPTYATEITVGKPYKLGMFSTEKNAEYYFIGSMSGYYGATDTDYNKGVDVYAETTSGGYRLYFMNGSQKQYINLVVSGTHLNFTYSTTATSVFTWDSAKHSFYTSLNGENCYMGTFGSHVTIGVLSTSKLQDTDYIARFYEMSGSSSGGNDSGGAGDTSCQHNYTSVVTTPTCTKDGYTTYTCALCNDTYTGNQTSAIGHTYSNGTCTKCGETKPTDTTLTISFTTDSNRIEFSTTKQVWSQNGITVTNNKASSTVNVADFSNPARFYAGSNLTISCENMTKIEINCVGLASKYVSGWLNVSGATVNNNGGIITIEFASPVDSLTYTSLSAQSRAFSITVYTQAETVQCTHTNTSLQNKIDATCTSGGYTGDTVCNDCNEVISLGTSVNAIPHSEISHDAKAATCTENGWAAYVTCENCDYTTYAVVIATGHSMGEWVVTKEATCTTDGSEERKCNNCDHLETREVTALGHVEVNHDAKAATCTENGWEAYVTCENCDYTTYAEVSATGHNLGDWIETKPHTCKEKGKEERTCENCDYSETREVAPGHDWVVEDGYKFCGSCGEVIESEAPDTGDTEPGSGTFMDVIMNLIETIMNAISDIIATLSDLFS